MCRFLTHLYLTHLCNWFQHLSHTFGQLKETLFSHIMTKPTKWHVRPAKTQISLGICPVWSESSLCVWRKLGSLATHCAQAKTGWMIRLIWVFAGRTVILLALSWSSSLVKNGDFYLKKWRNTSILLFVHVHSFINTKVWWLKWHHNPLLRISLKY